MKTEFFYYTETGGEKRCISEPIDGEAHVPIDGVDVVTKDISAAYIVTIELGKDTESYRIILPEEINGWSVREALIIADPPRDNFAPKHASPLISYLYIPQSLQVISIPTAPFEFRIERQDANIRFNLLAGCEVEISPENPYFCVGKDGIYSKDMTELVYIIPPREGLDDYFAVSEGVKRIKKRAGSALNGVRELFIPKSVTEIEYGAFQYCPDLQKADIHAETLGLAAFRGCMSLRSVRADCRTIGKIAFTECIWLEHAELVDTEVIDDDAFSGCNSLENIWLPDTLKKLGDNAFYRSGITELSVPPNVEELGKDVIDCGGRLEVYLKDGLLPFRKEACPVCKDTFWNRDSVIVIRSAETHEKLAELVIIAYIDETFTPRGINMKKYDEALISNINSNETLVELMFKNRQMPEFMTYFESPYIKAVLRAISARLKYPYRLGENIEGKFREFTSERYEFILTARMAESGVTADKITEAPELEEVSDEGMLRLIDRCANAGLNELTAALMEKFHERKNRQDGK